MTIAECQVETQKHIERVRHYMGFFTDKLITRGAKQDHVILKYPAVEVFDKHTPAFATCAYTFP